MIRGKSMRGDLHAGVAGEVLQVLLVELVLDQTV